MPHTILYIEDETAIIELVKDVLEHPEIRLLTAFNGTEGIHKARALKPDLLIIDVIMPDRDGWSIHEEFRQDADFKQTPIIMLTAQLHKYRIKKEFENSLIDAYITKPFDAGSVREEIEKMLGVNLWSAPTAEKPVAAAAEKKPEPTAEKKSEPAAKKKEPEPAAVGKKPKSAAAEKKPKSASTPAKAKKARPPAKPKPKPEKKD